MEYLFPITPVPKPRMTRADSWKKRPVVLNYWAFKDQLNLLAKKQRFSASKFDSYDLIFFIPMPDSWSKKKIAENDSMPHRSRPDIDNLIKSVFDCLLEEDSHIWKVSAMKVWTNAKTGCIKVIV